MLDPSLLAASRVLERRKNLYAYLYAYLYVQGRELGRGQFGTVHLGKWLGIEVALKELFKGTRDEMLREAEMLSSLRHPCVVSFFGVYAADNTLLTVTEFMRGGSLRAALRALQGTFQARALRLQRQRNRRLLSCFACATGGDESGLPQLVRGSRACVVCGCRGRKSGRH